MTDIDPDYAYDLQRAFSDLRDALRGRYPTASAWVPWHGRPNVRGATPGAQLGLLYDGGLTVCARFARVDELSDVFYRDLDELSAEHLRSLVPVVPDLIRALEARQRNMDAATAQALSDLADMIKILKSPDVRYRLRTADGAWAGNVLLMSAQAFLQIYAPDRFAFAGDLPAHAQQRAALIEPLSGSQWRLRGTDVFVVCASHLNGSGPSLVTYYVKGAPDDLVTVPLRRFLDEAKEVGA